jgi:hypothetical protein
MVAEQRGLPATEGMEGHGHRDRHVDADHADLDAMREFTRDVAVRVKIAVPLPYSLSLIMRAAVA